MKQFILDEEINLLESQGDGGKGTADLLNTMSYGKRPNLGPGLIWLR